VNPDILQRLRRSKSKLVVVMHRIEENRSVGIHDNRSRESNQLDAVPRPRGKLSSKKPWLSKRTFRLANHCLYKESRETATHAVSRHVEHPGRLILFVVDVSKRWQQYSHRLSDGSSVPRMDSAWTKRRIDPKSSLHITYPVRIPFLTPTLLEGTTLKNYSKPKKHKQQIIFHLLLRSWSLATQCPHRSPSLEGWCGVEPPQIRSCQCCRTMTWRLRRPRRCKYR
jgi:hypothetical protein